ncbi:MAG TPA: GGDEF domain-containing protein, partial [Actinotalea sp.]|nr:GGDEF domain-containing protein [Actinotalea sp.]
MRAPHDGGLLLRPETRGWALAGLLAAAALVVVVLWLTPLTSGSRTAPMPWTAGALGVLAVLAAVLRRSTPGLWTVCAATVVLNAGLLASAVTLAGAVLTTAGFGYVVLFAAYAFDGRWLAWLLVLVAVVSPLGLAYSAPGFRAVTWIATTGGTLVAGALLGRVMAALRRLATFDALTGALTRTAFFALAPSALAAARRHGEPAVLVVVDLDDFK